MSLLPFLRIDLRRATRGSLTCSDASEYGAGVCHSMGLSLEGWAGCHELQRAVKRHGDSEVILIEVFGGIGGVRVSLERLGVHVHRHAFWDCDQAGMAVVRAVFPDAVLIDCAFDDLAGWFDRFIGFGPSDGLIVLAIAPPFGTWSHKVQFQR
eukprot:5664428-Amphidinium_carterae.1